MYNSKIILRAMLLVGACTLLVACASNADRPTVEQILQEKGLVKGESVDRVYQFRINGWQALDEQNLILEAGVKDQYLITLRSFCLNLEHAFSIGVTSRMSSVAKFDQIIVQEAGGGREYCNIDEIYKLTPAASE